MENEKKMQVKVETLPNGYALTVDCEEYMYFTPEQLMAGVFYHVGLARLDYVDVSHIEMLMEAILSWPTIKDAAQGQAIKMRELKETRCNLVKTRRQLSELDKKLQEEKDNLRECQGRLMLANKRIESDSDLSFRLDKALESVNKLNILNMKKEKENHEQAMTIAAMKREIAKYRKNGAAGGEKPNEPIVKGPDRKRYVRTRKDNDAAVLDELVRQQQQNKD